jgi:tRNA (mo5U34)-methyltransferase
MDRDTLVEALSRYSFYQTIDLGDGIKTPGNPVSPKQRQIVRLIEGMDLKGKTVVDLGCANGMFALAAEQQGAARVLAVDHTRENIESLERIILPRLNSRVIPVHANMLEFRAAEHGKFDLVIFGGLLYHLRFPFSALQNIRDLLVDRGQLILETGIVEDFNFNNLLYCPSPQDSPQRSRGGNACSFFNQRALLETLEYFGLRIRSQAVLSSPLRRFVKKLMRKRLTAYRISSIVLRCERDFSMDNRELVEFYESTTESLSSAR